MQCGDGSKSESGRIEVRRYVMDRDALMLSVFGFAASLLESVPIVGLFLSISNRIGAAMWYVVWLRAGTWTDSQGV